MTASVESAQAAPSTAADIVFMYQLLKGGKSDHQSIFFKVASMTKPAMSRQDLTFVLEQLAPIAIQMDKGLGGMHTAKQIEGGTGCFLVVDSGIRGIAETWHFICMQASSRLWMRSP